MDIFKTLLAKLKCLLGTHDFQYREKTIHKQHRSVLRHYYCNGCGIPKTLSIKYSKGR